jgi:hypothetical protein
MARIPPKHQIPFDIKEIPMAKKPYKKGEIE